MKVIIAGSRHGRPWNELFDAIEASALSITEVVHGGASGVDAQADAYARELDIPVTIFPANWKGFGKSAGPRRNALMADYADALIALDGGDGTASMIRAAMKKGIPVFIHPGAPRAE